MIRTRSKQINHRVLDPTTHQVVVYAFMRRIDYWGIGVSGIGMVIFTY